MTNGGATEIQPHHTELRTTHICVKLHAYRPPDDPVSVLSLERNLPYMWHVETTPSFL